MSNPAHRQCPTNASDFQKLLESSGCRDVHLQLQSPTKQARRITRQNFFFYDETLQYLITMIAASLGKFTAIGGTTQEGPLDVQMIGRALDEDIYFPGLPLLWANSLNVPVSELEVDIRTVAKDQKSSKTHHVAMRDVGAKADAVLFLEAFEKVKEQIPKKFGKGWFEKWPEVLRFAYLVRNALAHDGCWGIQDQKGREHYQWEIFRWPRANLSIQMRRQDGSKVDEGRPILDDLNGVDLIVLLFEINDSLR